MPKSYDVDDFDWANEQAKEVGRKLEYSDRAGTFLAAICLAELIIIAILLVMCFI